MAHQETQDQDHVAWVWLAVAAGALAGAIAAIWLVQYRKPDRRMDRLLRRCSDRLDTIEASVTNLLAPQADES